MSEENDIDNTDDDDPSTSESGRMEKRVWPFRNEQQVIDAAKKFSQRNLREFQKAEILARIRETGKMSAVAVSELLDTFPRQDITTKHTLLELFCYLVEQGADLSSDSDSIARYLNDPNYALRNKVADLLVSMGADAAGGAIRALGCTRHSVEDIKLCGVRVLGAIGPGCASAAGKRLRSMLDASSGSDGELSSAVAKAIRSVFSNPTKVIEQSKEKAEARDTECSPRESQVILAVVEASTAFDDPKNRDNIKSKLSEISVEGRITVLFRCLQSKDANVRMTSAWLMSLFWEDVISHVREINRFYQRETNLEIRGHLADTLTCILCELTLRKMAG